MKKYIYSERVNLFEPNVYIHFLVQITGAPSPEDLVLAVKTAFSMNEVTMSRIVLEKDGAAFYEKMNESGCNVTIMQKYWMELIRENEKNPFEINHGEFIRCFVIPSDANLSLLIMAQHLVGDGKSIVYFIEDVMKALSGEKLVYKPLNLVNETNLPSESKLPFLLKLYVSSLNRKWLHSGRSFTWNDYYEIHETYWKHRSSKIVYEKFSPEETNKMQLYAKEMEISVNSYIATAFLKANSDNGTIGMAVDARLDHNRSMSNQATGISVDYTYSRKLSFAENARIVHQKVQKKLRHPVMKYFILRFIELLSPTLIDSVLLHSYDLYQNNVTHRLAKIMGYKGKKTRELGITNLTRLDISNTYGSYGITDALFIPPVVSYAKHIIGVSTMEDVMMITYHFMSEQDEIEELDFFNAAIQNIRHNEVDL